MSAQFATVSTDLELDLVVPGGDAVPVPATVAYRADDPYAVHVTFRTGLDEDVRWTFARQLLTDGVSRPVGEGDVHVWPVIDAVTPAIGLSLSSPSGAALFQAPLSELVEFLAQTYAAVPTGAESDFLDLDAELALLLWTGDAPSA